jgi:MOSC domain-containing protein YiiM
LSCLASFSEAEYKSVALLWTPELNRNAPRRIQFDFTMRVLSLSVGLPREVTWHNRVVTTGIFKQPVSGRVPLRKLNFDGDRQADLIVHGGEFKAVYCYPSEHYAYWRKEMPAGDFPTAVFGENLTTEGMFENSLHLGDRFRVGSAEVVVTQPRLPCYKLGVRFKDDQMVKRFLASKRSGFYLAVTKEGAVGAGDEMIPLSRDPRAVPVSEITRLFVSKGYTADDAAIIDRLNEVPSVPEDWKSYFAERRAE